MHRPRAHQVRRRNSWSSGLRALLAMVDLMFVGIVPKGWQTCIVVDVQQSRPTVDSQSNSKVPIRQLPIRAEYLRRFPRERFAFVFETGWGERIDTFNGFVTKDLIADRDTTIRLVLSDAEMDTVYRAALAIGVFDYADSEATRGGPPPPVPSTWARLKLRAGNVTKELHWGEGCTLTKSGAADISRLFELIRLIQGIVVSHPEYRTLPTARGVYD